MANNFLAESLDRYVSDPLNYLFDFHQLNKKGKLKLDSNGFHLCHCTRGTNLTELFHNILFATYGTWEVGNRVFRFLADGEQSQK